MTLKFDLVTRMADWILEGLKEILLVQFNIILYLFISVSLCLIYLLINFSLTYFRGQHDYFKFIQLVVNIG